MQYPHDFLKSEALSLWMPKDSKAFDYSEGEEAERYLKTVLKEVSDRSCHSSELFEKIKDWSSEYHLHPKRSNLFRPLKWKKDTRVLELGAGCGSLTRFLGEQGLDVYAVEGSPARAEMAALRCEELGNVKVICSNFEDITFEEGFDVVTLIGVLEYSKKYIDNPQPHHAALKLAKRFLKPDGALILAFENKLGLKYFAGCSEDHTQIPYDGIHGYPSQYPVETFGKAEIQKLLGEVELSHQSFLYPFPDYKMPEVVLNLDEAKKLGQEPFLYRWTGYQNARDYTQQRTETFQEFLAAKELESNGLLDAFSNSFLIVASAQEGVAESWVDSQTLASKYSVSRAKKHMVEVALKQEAESLQIQRQHLYPEFSKDAASEGDLKQQLPSDESFVTGELLMEQVARAFACKVSSAQDALKPLLKQWFEFLNKASFEENGEVRLPAHYLDCVPGNLVLHEGGLQYIDDEWHFEGLLRDFVLFRGFLYCYNHLFALIQQNLEGVLKELDFQSFLGFGLEILEHGISEEQLQVFWKLEWEFQQQIHLREQLNYEEYIEHLVGHAASNNGILKMRQMETDIENLQEIQSNLQSELQTTHGSLFEAKQNLEKAKHKIHAMEGSVFWRLRGYWLKCKSGLKGSSHDPLDEIQIHFGE